MISPGPIETDRFVIRVNRPLSNLEVKTVIKSVERALQVRCYLIVVDCSSLRLIQLSDGEETEIAGPRWITLDGIGRATVKVSKIDINDGDAFIIESTEDLPQQMLKAFRDWGGVPVRNRVLPTILL